MKIKNIFLGTMMALSLVGCTGGGTTETKDEYTVPTYNEESVQIHYYRKDSKYDKWALWLWSYPGGEGKEYTFNGTDDYGAVASYPLSNWKDVKSGGLGFIVKSAGSWNSKDPDGDRIINFNKVKKDEKDVYHVYLQSGDKNVYMDTNLTVPNEITDAKFENMKRILIQTNSEVASYKVYEGSTILNKDKEKLDTPSKTIRYTFPEGEKPKFDKAYKVEVTFADTGEVAEAPISINSLYKSSDFANEYNYDGELGAIYSKESTTFKVWSPVSKKITLRIFNNGTPKSVDSVKGSDEKFLEVDLTKGEKGVFSTTVNGDLAGKYYTYLVSNGTYNRKETVDPYAFSTGVNGLRGMIVDLESTNPTGWDETQVHAFDQKHLTVYETHVADITSSSTWTSDAEIRKLQKTFKGAMTTGTTYTENGVTVKTGFDHIKELGVNAVQLIPVFDQANDEINTTFNWGYNPANYNVIEGAYSTNPYDGAVRVKEFKELVKAYNKAGMNIIMDVVYNHMNGAAGSPFDVLVPGYYFRYNSDGTLSNGSGCGNETASDMPMMRKFMVDSTCFLAKEYKLGGFRFDLMGLHDLETMALLTSELKKINENIVVYGEPWQGGTSTLQDSSTAKQDNMSKYKGYGAFNDKMRDALIKGGLNSASSKGWVTSTATPSTTDLGDISRGIIGSVKVSSGTVSDPNKVVNYVTCHDNYTLYDRIKAAGIKDEATIKKMAMLANSIVFTSNGTSFMLAGEEFLRTKGGNSNSYNASYKVNELDYSLKIKNIDMFHNYQKLISLKQTLSGLALASGQNSTVSVDTSKGNVISYTITDSVNSRTYKIYHVNGANSGSLPQVDLSGYNLYLDTINSSKVLGASTQLESFETLIAYK